MLSLYDLLPDFYHLEDEKLGWPLKKLLTPLQEALDAVYEDEKQLRLIQDPHKAREDFLKWIALSLGWKLFSEDPEAQRNEITEIINFYDLKGTPYGIRLLAALTLGEWFETLTECYDKHEASISSIHVPWSSIDPRFKYLLAGNGHFAEATWREKKINERGKPYDISDDNRDYHYIIEINVPPGSFAPGELRAAAKRFISHYERLHPAGRFAYLHFRTVSGEDPRPGGSLVRELCGGFYLDIGETFDGQKCFDMERNPIHPSLSWSYPKIPNTLDLGAPYDQEWRWDGAVWVAHVVAELS